MYPPHTSQPRQLQEPISRAERRDRTAGSGIKFILLTQNVLWSRHKGKTAKSLA